MQIHYETYKLPNGANILLIPSDTVNSVTVRATFKSGTAFENKKTQGLTHFVEHMTLTCTEKWPTKEQLNELVEYNGGETNGTTDYEYLNYYINIPGNKIEFGFEYINQILYHAVFDEKNIETERTVILDEISKFSDEAYYKAWEFIEKKLLKKKSGYTFEVAGTVETVSGFSKDNLLNLYKTSHAPDRLLLCVMGNFDIAEAKKYVDKYFADIQKQDIKPEYPKEDINEKIIAAKKNKKTDLIISNIIFKYKGRKQLSFKESLMADFVSKIFGGPLSSRLMKRLRDKEGLLYGIYCTPSNKSEFGRIEVEYEVKPEFYEKTLKIVKEELDNFYENGITQKELEHFKEYLVNRLTIKYDDFFSYTNLIRVPVFYRQDPHTLPEIIECINSMDITQINAFIKKYMNPSNANYFAFGNIQPDTEKKMKAILG